MVKGKTTNGLMRHLRNTHGISISGSRNKKDLLNMGYYHGYKGYRFINKSQNQIPYTNFDEIVAVYQFDTSLKTLLYPNIMLIETALKNRTLDTLIGIGPVDFDYVFTHLMLDYKKHSTGNADYRKKMKSRLELRNKINSTIAYNYSNKKALIQHFIHQNKPIPLWAIFELIDLGIFGFFINCLDEDTRISITKDLKMHSTAHNQNGRILEDIIFTIKDLRNAVAHNSVVFDCRFKTSNPPSRLKEYLQNETSISGINFSSIIDYLILVTFLLKKLGISKTELKRIIRSFSADLERLKNEIPMEVFTSIMGSDVRSKIEGLSRYI